MLQRHRKRPELGREIVTVFWTSRVVYFDQNEGTPSSVISRSRPCPQAFKLAPNYPNPFNPADDNPLHDRTFSSFASRSMMRLAVMWRRWLTSSDRRAATTRRGMRPDSPAAHTTYVSMSTEKVPSDRWFWSSRQTSWTTPRVELRERCGLTRREAEVAPVRARCLADIRFSVVAAPDPVLPRRSSAGH
jgi:hypothetical protein